MTNYRFNVATLTPIFGKTFGLPLFAADFYKLVDELNRYVARSSRFYCWSVQSNASLTERDYPLDYPTYCKLSHFFSDFNCFINFCLSKKDNLDSNFNLDEFIEIRSQDFLRRIESMKVPEKYKSLVSTFLSVQSSNYTYRQFQKKMVAEGYVFDLPAIFSKGDLNIYQGRPKKNIALEKEVKEKLKADLYRAGRNSLLEKLAKTWEKHPTLRLGQLIVNSIPEGTDLFYLSDAKLLELLTQLEQKYDGLPNLRL